MLTVGAFARLSGVSAKVLRLYDGAGLFRPAWVDPGSGYRYYTPTQLPELRRILALRDLGMPLARIARLVAGGDDLAAALDGRRADLERERADLDRRLAALDIEVALARRGATGPDVVVRRIAPEPVATLDAARTGGDIGAAFYEAETYVRDHRRRAHRPPGSLERPDGSTVFVPVVRSVPPSERIGFTRLPEVRAATVLHRGPYETLDATRTALLDWTAAAGLAPAGPLRILYLQFGAEPELRLPRGWVVQRAAEFVTELQQPVAPAVDG